MTDYELTVIAAAVLVGAGASAEGAALRAGEVIAAVQSECPDKYIAHLRAHIAELQRNLARRSAV